VAPVAFKHYESLAGTAAEIASEKLPDGDGPVVLVLEETDSAPLASREKVFVKTASSLGVKDVVVIEAGSGEWSSENGWSPSLLRKVSDEAPGNRGIISFVGTPPGQVLKQNPPRPVSPYFLAVLPPMENLDAFMQAGIVHDAVIPTKLADTPSVSPKSSNRDWFDAYYQLYTPSTTSRTTTTVTPGVISAPGSKDEVQY